jgi:hypothetical protein
MKDMSMNERNELPLPLCRLRACNMKRATLRIETLGTGTGTAKKCFSSTASSQRSRRPEAQGDARSPPLSDSWLDGTSTKVLSESPTKATNINVKANPA